MKPRNKIQPLPFVLPALFVYILTVIIPILWSMGYSLFSWNGIGDMKFIGLENYVRMFQDETFLKVTGNTFYFTGKFVPVMCRTDPGNFAYTYFQRWKYSAGYLFYSMYHFIYGDLPDFFQNAFCPAPGPGLLCDGKTGNGTYRFAGKFPYSADYHNPDRWI